MKNDEVKHLAKSIWNSELNNPTYKELYQERIEMEEARLQRQNLEVAYSAMLEGHPDFASVPNPLVMMKGYGKDTQR